MMTGRTPFPRRLQKARRLTGGITLSGLVPGGLVLLLTGCAPPIDGTRPSFPFAQHWQAAVPGTPRLIDNRNWWQALHDPTLDRLITYALAGNPDLEAARARAKAAELATGSVSDALTATGGLEAQKTGGNLRTERGHSALDMSFELLFDPGREREALRLGAGAEATAAKAELDGAQLYLIGTVCDSYLTLRHSQQRLRLAHDETSRQRQTLELARELDKFGEGTKIEIIRSEAQLESLRATMPGLEAAVATKIVQLTILLGAAPGSLPPDLSAALQKASGQPRAQLTPDPGVPADLIRNRPDLRLAEANYDVARAALGQARAALYPRLSLSGSIEARRTITGTGSYGGGLIEAGPSLRLPDLPQTAAKAETSAAEQRVIAAHADWTSAVLGA